MQGPDGNSSCQRLIIHVVKVGQVLQICCIGHTGFDLVTVQTSFRTHHQGLAYITSEGLCIHYNCISPEMLIAAVIERSRSLRLVALVKAEPAG